VCESIYCEAVGLSAIDLKKAKSKIVQAKAFLNTIFNDVPRTACHFKYEAFEMLINTHPDNPE
jgi:hypothetical protein